MSHQNADCYKGCYLVRETSYWNQQGLCSLPYKRKVKNESSQQVLRLFSPEITQSFFFFFFLPPSWCIPALLALNLKTEKEEIKGERCQARPSVTFNHQKASLAAAAAQVSIYNVDQELPTSSSSSGTNILETFLWTFSCPCWNTRLCSRPTQHLYPI